MRETFEKTKRDSAILDISDELEEAAEDVLIDATHEHDRELVSKGIQIFAHKYETGRIANHKPISNDSFEVFVNHAPDDEKIPLPDSPDKLREELREKQLEEWDEIQALRGAIQDAPSGALAVYLEMAYEIPDQYTYDDYVDVFFELRNGEI